MKYCDHSKGVENCSMCKHAPEVVVPDNSALLYCPFCGTGNFDKHDTLYPSGITWQITDGEKEYGKHRQFKNKCYVLNCVCGASVNADSESEVITLWNTRAI